MRSRNIHFFSVLTISADLPSITEELIDEIIAYYEHCGKPALTVAVPLETYEQIGMKPDYVFEAQGNRLVPVGINIIDGRHIDKPRMEEEIFVLRRADQVVNVNTVSDLEIAEKLLSLKQSAIF